MKQLIAIFTCVLLTGFTAHATTTNYNETNSFTKSSVRGYGKSFIFIEEGIEFSVFPDGQFDFFMTNYGPNVSVFLNTTQTSISFNSGYDYNAYVQYDEYGAIVQIEHIPVYYDYYGRVEQVGNVCINYNRFGYVSQVGGLYVHYNRYYQFSHCSGFINVFNRFYVARPWHSLYRIPHFNHCVVFNRPYRQNYRPIREHYTRPYVNNLRRTTAVASRRGNTVNRINELATRRNSTAINGERSNTVRPRRGNVISTQSTPRTRAQINTPRPNVSVKPRAQSKPIVTSNTSRPYVSSKPRTKSKQSKQITHPSRSQKSKSNQLYKYKKNKNSGSKRLASNTRKRR